MPGPALDQLLPEPADGRSEVENLAAQSQHGGTLIGSSDRSSEPLWHTIQCAAVQLAAVLCGHVTMRRMYRHGSDTGPSLVQGQQQEPGLGHGSRLKVSTTAFAAGTRCVQIHNPQSRCAQLE